MYRLLVVLALAACADDASSEPGVPDAPVASGRPSNSPPQPARAGRDVDVLPSRAAGPVATERLAVPAATGGVAEVEPNEEPATASPLDARGAGTGAITVGEGSRDTDVWRFEVTEGDGLWAVVVDGEVNSATLKSAATTVAALHRSADGTRFQRDSLALTPGTYFVEVYGRADAEYHVQMSRIGTWDPRVETEPNDAWNTAHVLDLGEERAGWMPTDHDVDVYRLSLPSRRFVRLTFDTPADADFAVRLRNTTTNSQVANETLPREGGPHHYDAMLIAGEYEVQLSTTRSASDSPYTVRVDPLEPFDLPSDLEPNNSWEQARPLPPHLSVRGDNGLFSEDRDDYRLPEASATGATTVRVVGGAEHGVNRIWYIDADHRDQRPEFDAETNTFTLPAGAVGFTVRRDGPYELAIAVDGLVPEAPPVAPDVTVQAPDAPVAVAAWWGEGQHVTVPFTVSGPTGPVDLSAVSSDARYRTHLASTQVTIPASGQVTVPVQVTVPEDAWANQPPHISLAASRAGSAVSAAHTLVDPVCGAPPVDPRVVWDTPEALLGGLNVAASSLGAEVVQGDRRLAELLDGFTPSSASNKYRGSLDFPVRLAAPARVAGFLLDSGGNYGPTPFPRPFTIELSSDGQSWSEVLAGDLAPRNGEQAFVLSSPQQAAFARLRFAEGADVHISEFKVVAVPGSRPLGDVRHDLASKRNDGRFVHTAPYMGTFDHMLSDDGDGPRIKVGPEAPIEMVVAFRHHRAARVASLEWTQPARPEDARTELSVFTSMASPVGPWTPVGTWSLDPSPGSTSRFDLPTDGWTRYVRLVNDEERAEPVWTRLASRLRILERPAGPDAPSALGEWDKYDPLGPYEAQHGVAQRVTDTERGEDDTRDTARSLSLDVLTSGAVSVNVDEDWYRIDVPAGANRLEVIIEGDVRTELQDDRGSALPHRLTDGVLTADVQSGAVFLRVTEPKRNVAMSWDQSGSVGQYVERIYQSVGEFTRGVDPAVETANLLPFQGPEGAFLSPAFLDDPIALQRVLTDYDRSASSSEAESALLTAMEQMEVLDGTKAILLLTDAETHSNRRTPELWQRFSRVRPRVFTMELHIGNVQWHQHLMEDWANIDAGHYTPFGSMSSLDAAFERAACHLRRPMAYALTASVSTEAPPEPGSLTVTAEDGFQGAVEVIVDASGSMQNRIGQKTRIGIARDVLRTLVTDTLPAGTPFALRAFGHRESGSCRTDLEIPLGPLDPAQASAVTDTLQAKDLARTPLGASLQAVRDDLSSHDGPVMVVLLTDGKETCGGDPGDTIALMKEEGMDVRVNIVGFAIDDAALASNFAQWATLGGGLYLPADSEDELASAMIRAVQPRFQVLDAVGDVVAEGTVGGETVPLEPGAYSVRVQTSPVQRFDIVVEDGEAERIAL